MFGLTFSDIPLLICLPVLLLASAFFSGTETALFSLRSDERALLKQRRDKAAVAASRLLARPRQLLVTILFGNMVVNVIYFILSSILLLHMHHQRVEDQQTFVDTAITVISSAVFLLVIILFGEVAPKLIATRIKLQWVNISSVPLFAIHEIISPVRVPLTKFIIQPLTRLLAPRDTPAPVDADELVMLLKLANEQEIINHHERELVEDVIELSRIKVRDIMTPRVDIKYISLEHFRNAREREQVLSELKQAHCTYMPITGENLDEIVGIIKVNEYLLNFPVAAEQGIISEAVFIPEQATVDQLLYHIKHHAVKCAVVVDEYGQTAGIVTLVSILSVLSGSNIPAGRKAAIGRNGTTEGLPPIITLISPGKWRVPASMPLHEFAEHFSIQVHHLRVSSIGGYVIAQLGVIPAVGDVLELEGWNVSVSEMAGSQLVSLEVEIIEDK